MLLAENIPELSVAKTIKSVIYPKGWTLSRGWYNPPNLFAALRMADNRDRRGLYRLMIYKEQFDGLTRET